MDEAIKILGHVRNLLVAGIFLAIGTAAYMSLSGGPSRTDCVLERHEQLMGRAEASPACRR